MKYKPGSITLTLLLANSKFERKQRITSKIYMLFAMKFAICN